MAHLFAPFAQGVGQSLSVVQEEGPFVPSLEQQTLVAEFAALLCLVEMAYSSVLYGQGEVRLVPLFAEEQHRIPFA